MIQLDVALLIVYCLVPMCSIVAKTETPNLTIRYVHSQIS